MPCKITAFKISNTDGWGLEPAGGKRDWMDSSKEKFAYRCLPLVMANQAGWVITCPLDVVAKWNGKPEPNGVTLHFPNGEGVLKNHIAAHFGAGIVTFSIPWLFRTTKGYGLWARGPANVVKDNIVPLDGIVETDWAPYTFTMNWKIQRRNSDVFFKKGDPVCMLVPFPMDLLEATEVEMKHLDDDLLLKEDFYQFTARRSGNIRQLKATGQGEWAMDYMRGHLPDGTEVNTHRKAFRLREFKAAEKP